MDPLQKWLSLGNRVWLAASGHIVQSDRLAWPLQRGHWHLPTQLGFKLPAGAPAAGRPAYRRLSVPSLNRSRLCHAVCALLTSEILHLSLSCPSALPRPGAHHFRNLLLFQTDDQSQFTAAISSDAAATPGPKQFLPWIASALLLR